MKLSHLLGVAIPSIIILSLIVIGSLNIGVTVEKFSPKTINIEELYKVNQTGEIIGPTIRTIRVKNDFILSRTENIEYIICTNGGENNYPQTLGYKVYVDGTNFGSGSSYSYNSNLKIQISPGEEKTVEIKPATYYYRYDLNSGNLPEELLLFEKRSGSSFSSPNCQNLISEDYDSAIVVKLV